MTFYSFQSQLKFETNQTRWTDTQTSKQVPNNWQRSPLFQKPSLFLPLDRYSFTHLFYTIRSKYRHIKWAPTNEQLKKKTRSKYLICWKFSTTGLTIANTRSRTFRHRRPIQALCSGISTTAIKYLKWSLQGVENKRTECLCSVSDSKQRAKR